MDVVADGVDAPRAGGRLAEQVPRDVGEAIRLAVSASEEENERLLGKIFQLGDSRQPRRDEGVELDGSPVSLIVVSRE